MGCQVSGRSEARERYDRRLMKLEFGCEACGGRCADDGRDAWIHRKTRRACVLRSRGRTRARARSACWKTSLSKRRPGVTLRVGCNQRSKGVKVAFSIGCLSDKPARCVCALAAREAWPGGRLCGNTVKERGGSAACCSLPFVVETAVVAGKNRCKTVGWGVTKRNLSDCCEVGRPKILTCSG